MLHLFFFFYPSLAASIAKCFTVEGGKFNLVFNLACETKYSQTVEVHKRFLETWESVATNIEMSGLIALRSTTQVYREKILDLKKKLAAEAVKQGVERFIDVSTAQVYEAGKVRIAPFLKGKFN